MKKIMLFLAVALLSAPAASFAQKMTVTILFYPIPL